MKILGRGSAPAPDLEVLELRQMGANLQRLLCLNLSCVDDDAMGDPAGVAASQSLLLLLETLQRIPVTWQLLQQSQIAVCVRACCQVQFPPLCLLEALLLELVSSRMHFWLLKFPLQGCPIPAFG